jgi:hypothetical protein
MVEKVVETFKVVDVIETFNLSCNADAWNDWNCSANPIGKNDTRVVQKLQFLNNNRLKKKKNMGFLRKPMFFARLVQ